MVILTNQESVDVTEDSSLFENIDLNGKYLGIIDYKNLVVQETYFTGFLKKSDFLQ